MIAAGGAADVIISSCCHTVNTADSEVLSPRRCPIWPTCFRPCRPTARYIKRAASRRDDRLHRPLHLQKGRRPSSTPAYVDCVLTFEELSDWLEADEASPWSRRTDCNRRRATAPGFFPTSGGILAHHGQREDTGLRLHGGGRRRQLHRRPARTSRRARLQQLLYRDDRLRGQLHRRPGHGASTTAGARCGDMVTVDAAYAGPRATSAVAAQPPTWTRRSTKRIHLTARCPASGRSAKELLAKMGKTSRRSTSSTAAPAGTTPAGRRPLPSARARPT